MKQISLLFFDFACLAEKLDSKFIGTTKRHNTTEVDNAEQIEKCQVEFATDKVNVMITENDSALLNSRGLTTQEIREFTHQEGSIESGEMADKRSEGIRSSSNNEDRLDKILSQRK